MGPLSLSPRYVNVSSLRIGTRTIQHTRVLVCVLVSVKKSDKRDEKYNPLENPHRYLYEFLFGWIVSALTRADSFLLEQECFSEQFKNLSKGQKKSKLKKKKMKPYGRELMFTQALQNVCGGYYKALAGFHKADRIPQPLSEFDLEQIRYEHRFGPFAELSTPPAIGYSDFCAQKMSLLKLTQEELFLNAAKHFHQARSILELVPNLDPEVTLL